MAWIAFIRARAESAVSSTATRAEGPDAGSMKSMLRVCSAGACTGWSKYTVASVTLNQPDGPFPLPAIETFSVRYVHMAAPFPNWTITGVPGPAAARRG